jgi:prophage DNA circulation protein
MTFRDKLNRVVLADGRIVIGASFRAVPFLVSDGDRAGGRRVIVHEFPQRDAPFVEELGRRSRRFRVDGYVIGDDYLEQRDALLGALEDTSGPGELVHPNYGRVRAVCANVTTRESTRDGRMATFQIDFVEAPEQTTAPVESADLAAGVLITAESSLLAIGTELQEGYDATDAPAYATASLIAETTDRANGLNDALAKVVDVIQELAALDNAIDSLISDVATLIRTPSALFARFVGVFANIEETIQSAPDRVWQACVDAYNVAEQAAVLGASLIRQTEQANLDALTASLKRALVVEAAKLLPSIEFETTDDARTFRADTLALLDEQAALAADDATYGALLDLRASIVAAIPGDDELARVLTLTRNTAIPSLLLTYQAYGSVARESEIIARNSVEDPAFISGEIEILSS